MANIHLVSKQAFDSLRAQPSNPPMLDELFTVEQFSDEYAQVHESLLTQISAVGTHDWSGEADFTMNDDVPLAREIGVALTSKTLWNARFLEIIQRTLAAAPQEYRVYVDHDLLDDPDFYFFVFPDRVVAWSNSPDVLEVFGTVQPSDS